MSRNKGSVHKIKLPETVLMSDGERIDLLAKLLLDIFEETESSVDCRDQS